MQEQTIAIYCICEGVSKCLWLVDDPQSHMSTAEVMTFAIVAAVHFHGCYRTTRLVSINYKYYPKILGYSRLVRRIHKIPEVAWLMVFRVFRMYLSRSDSNYFIVDSLPIRAYENQKSLRASIFKGKPFHGYIASKKQYFFGIKIHMIVDQDGVPIEFCFTPGSCSDLAGLKQLPCELPEGSLLFADRAYTDYKLEDDLLEMSGISLLPKRKTKLKRQHSGPLEYLLSRTRNRIETVFSSIVRRMPRYIRAKTEKGFCLKILLFILAHVVCLGLSKGSSLQ